MSGIDEQTLIAYLDGELISPRRARVQAALAGDAELRRRLETQRRLGERLTARYDLVAREPVPGHLRQLIETGTAQSTRSSAPAPRSLWPLWSSLAVLAAAFALGISAGRSTPGGAAAPKSAMAVLAAPARILDGRVRPDRAIYVGAARSIDGSRRSRATG